MQEIRIDGCSLFFEKLETSGDDAFAIPSLSADELETALEPIFNIGKGVQTKLSKLAPNDIEISLQLSLAIKNGKVFFIIMNGGIEAQFAVKLVWKKD